MLGRHKDAPGHLKDVVDGFKDVRDTRGWGLRTIIVIVTSDLIGRFMITLQVHQWKLMTTGYLDPNGYKRDKAQGPYSLNLLYSKEPLKSKDFLYFLLLVCFCIH